jgi:hypothetical protein
MKTLKQCTTLEEIKVWVDNFDYYDPTQEALQRAFELGWNEAIEAAAMQCLNCHISNVDDLSPKAAANIAFEIACGAIRALKRPTQEKGE